MAESLTSPWLRVLRCVRQVSALLGSCGPGRRRARLRVAGESWTLRQGRTGARGSPLADPEGAGRWFRWWFRPGGRGSGGASEWWVRGAGEKRFWGGCSQGRG